MPIVRLEWYEVWVASGIGAKRHLEALKTNRPNRHGASEDHGWTLHIEGAAGEIAAAKAMDRYYSGTVNTFKLGGDIGTDIQIRTRSKDYYELLIRPDDRDDQIFVLVTGKCPLFNVRGWLRGGEAKRPEWWNNHGNREFAYFVPHSELRDINELRPVRVSSFATALGISSGVDVRTLAFRSPPRERA